MLFDTHTHIYLPEFDNDRDDVVDRALENGVTRLMLPNVDLDTIDALQHTLNAYPDMCSAAMGLHPTSVTENYRKDLDHIFEILDTNSYQAVGEIGIDLYWDKSYQKEQIDAFEMQIRYAAQHSLPVIIHCREALDSILPVLHKLSHLDVRGVFHSFSGSSEELSRIFESGDFYIGINGIVTFKKSSLRETLSAIPLDRLLLETDAPYLAPVPYRGKRNEPAFVRHTAEFIANELHMETLEIETITYKNACRLFNLPAE